MRILVCVKQVPDTESRIKIADDKKSIDPTDINWILNPYDETAYCIPEAEPYQTELSENIERIMRETSALYLGGQEIPVDSNVLKTWIK